MAFYKITHNEKHRFATVHNYGCTFRCPICSYKLRSGPDGRPGHAYPAPERFLSLEEVCNALSSVDVDRVNFMGGEPTVAPDLPAVLEFARRTLGVRTALGHTNGSRLPLPNLDAANVGLKAWDEGVHLQYTGRPKALIFDNFAAAVDAGLDMRANVVFVPGLVDVDQVEAIAAWLAGLSPEIPFHIMGYIPVPGQPYARPTAEQVDRAVAASRRHLANVASSRLDSSEALSLSKRDDRFDVRRIA
ncbi:MAG: radical SAM protein [Candidatus Brocadiaceae bacterium]|nr:radical SAM protein [Candidatus Brocadiaceae bacterium]